MKIQLLSDLHLESGFQARPPRRGPAGARGRHRLVPGPLAPDGNGLRPGALLPPAGPRRWSTCPATTSTTTRLRRDARSPARAVPRTGHPLAGTRNVRVVGAPTSTWLARHAPAWRTLHGGTDARTGHRLPAMAGRSAAPALRRRHSSSRTSPHAGQRRSALRRHARHRRLLQCAGRCCRAPTTGCTATCIARWTIGRLPCYRQSAGIRKEGRARELAGADLGCEDGEVADG